jgi:hypothetical protein
MCRACRMNGLGESIEDIRAKAKMKQLLGLWTLRIVRNCKY